MEMLKKRHKKNEGNEGDKTEFDHMFHPQQAVCVLSWPDSVCQTVWEVPEPHWQTCTDAVLVFNKHTTLKHGVTSTTITFFCAALMGCCHYVSDKIKKRLKLRQIL